MARAAFADLLNHAMKYNWMHPKPHRATSPRTSRPVVVGPSSIVDGVAPGGAGDGCGLGEKGGRIVPGGKGGGDGDAGEGEIGDGGVDGTGGDDGFSEQSGMIPHV